jgi:phytoene dehydrogenase-like protein
MSPWIHGDAPIPGLFLTVTSLKDPTKKLPRGVHTMEAFTFVAWEDFERWAHTKYGDRTAGYAAMKQELQARMLGELERIVPGLRDNLEFVELGTPLTNEHYVAATRGNLYGTEKTMKNLGPFAYQLGTEIRDLYLCGASTISHGVMGATMSGLFAAGKILHCDARTLLTPGGESVGLYRTDDPSRWPEAWRTASLADDVQQEAALAP